ncbi:MAG: UbiD family decarboxylase [Steroidobacteraceae bacterium]|nr:UbiD family decarboxylase [Steroidobacteraceae bacterium]MDW8260748.1 UbiD family decarboxylase [Gammaproteobacteria bacterium]
MSINRREFLSGSAGLSAAAFAGADRALAQALRQQPAASPPAPQANPPPPAPQWQFGPFDDLRSYVRELERRGLLLRVKDLDQDRYEATALMYRLVDRFGMYEAPTLYIENIKIDGRRHKGPIIANHFGHWHTECVWLGIEPVHGDHFATYYKALARVEEYLKLGKGGAFPQAPFREIPRSEAPCKEVILTGSAVDITRFAFIQSNPMDAGRYVNTGSVFTNDQELGKNFGTYRCEIKGPTMLGVNPEPGQGGWQAFMKAKERGEKAVPISIVVGQDPVTWVVSGSKLNRANADELEVVSGIRGKPLPVVKSETNDHLVPANAEMIIEGEVILDQPMLPEGPFGEMYGYMGRKKEQNFWMTIRCITHRRAPWIVNSFTGVTRGFATAPLEQLALAGIRRFFPNVKMIHSPVEATGLTFVSIKKQKPGEALEIGKRIAEVVGIAKVIVVVDDDLEVLDRVQIMHAMGSRWQPQPATAIIPRARGMPLDPSLTEVPYTSKIVIDATRQWPDEGGPREYQALNRAALQELAPQAFALADAHWKKHVGRWRPPGV